MLDKIRGFWMLWGLEKQAVQEVRMNTEIKPGWKTSEFWLTVLAQVPSVLGLFLGATNPITLGVGAACIVAYNISRATHKTAVVKAAILAGAQAAADAAKSADVPAETPAATPTK